MSTQQAFLRETAAALGLSDAALAERMGAPWAIFEKWLLPLDSEHAKEMPASAWQLAREIFGHEKQLAKHADIGFAPRCP